MQILTDTLISAIHAALVSLEARRGEKITRSIRPVVFANLDRGRVSSFVGGELQRVPEYVEKVADGYERLNAFITSIQGDKSAQAWEPLFKQLVNWAYNYFIRKNFYSSSETRDIANQCATEAAIIMLDAHFPYDTDFDPWAHVIVINSCRKYMRKETQKSAIPVQNLVEFEEATLTKENLSNPDSQLFQRSELIDVVSQLPDSRRLLIEMIYFEGLSPGEVARRMGKSVSAVYSLHFNALADLRKILVKDSESK